MGLGTRPNGHCKEEQARKPLGGYSKDPVMLRFATVTG